MVSPPPPTREEVEKAKARLQEFLGLLAETGEGYATAHVYGPEEDGPPAVYGLSSDLRSVLSSLEGAEALAAKRLEMLELYESEDTKAAALMSQEGELIASEARAEKAEQALAEANRERRALAGFSSQVLEALWENYDLDGGDIQDLGTRFGLIEAVAFDPDRHVDVHGVGAEAGDDWFVQAPWLNRLADSDGGREP